MSIINKNGFFKFDKSLHHKINSGHYVRPVQHQFFSFLLGKIDQSAKAKGNGGYVYLPYESVTSLFKNPSSFSRMKRDLAERNIIKLRQTVRRVGRGDKAQDIVMQRMNDIAINFNTSEWIPYERKNGNSRLTLIAMGLKARLEHVEYEKNPILREMTEPLEPTTNLHSAIQNSTLMREHYIPVFGLRLCQELLNTLENGAFHDKDEVEINKQLRVLFKNPRAQEIALQREIYRKRHKTLYGDYINFEKAYALHVGGVTVKDEFLSTLYTHRSRIQNMDKAFLSIERVRRLVRASLLSVNQVIVDSENVEKIFNYNEIKLKGKVTHVSPITLNSAIPTKSLKEQVVRDISVPAGDYPVMNWKFGLDSLEYPEFKAGDRPVQIVNNQVYKTHSSDLSDKIMAMAQEQCHTLRISDETKTQLRTLDSFEMGYIRAFNPDYQFLPSFFEVRNKESFLLMHVQNICALLDCNLIGEDDFEIALQVLLDTAKTIDLPYGDPVNARLDNLIEYVNTSLFNYSQKSLAMTLARFANPFDMNRQAVMLVQPHKSAFDVSKAKDYTENHFSKRIQELLETNDRTSYVDPFVTYAFKFSEKTEFTPEAIDESYEAYLENTTEETKLTIEEIFAYLNEDSTNSDYEVYRHIAPKEPPQ